MASSRGTSHARSGERLQDAFACCTPAGKRAPLIAVLCDGAGSAAMGREGASLVARVVASRAREHCRTASGTLSDDVIRSWVAEARDLVAKAAANRDLSTRDFAATMICLISDGRESLVAHVGDGAVVVQDAIDHSWHVLSWPSHGEYASTTFFVTDEPEPRLTFHRRSGPISALVAFTDGLERLALNFAGERAHAPFFDGILSPVVGSEATGRDGKLCAVLARYLDSPAVNARTDDDKTLLVAAYR